MASIKFDFGPDTITVDDLILIEDQEAAGGVSVRFTRDLLARYARDEETGEPLPEDEARATIGKMTLAQLNATMERMRSMVEDSRTDAVSGEADGS